MSDTIEKKQIIKPVREIKFRPGKKYATWFYLDPVFYLGMFLT
jgi:hypothetical protein